MLGVDIDRLRQSVTAEMLDYAHQKNSDLACPSRALSAEAIVYFSDESNWMWGPTYQTILLVNKDLAASHIAKTLLKVCPLIIWNGSPDEEPLRLKTILRLGEAPDDFVGLLHTYSDFRSKSYSIYNLSIYPRQFEHFVGSHIGADWKKMNIQKMLALHLSLVDVVRKLNEALPIMCATIDDETQAFVEPDFAGRSIYLNAEVSSLIGLKGQQLTGRYDRYVALDF
jgi:hypothetical protein